MERALSLERLADAMRFSWRDECLVMRQIPSGSPSHNDHETIHHCFAYRMVAFDQENFRDANEELGASGNLMMFGTPGIYQGEWPVEA